MYKIGFDGLNLDKVFYDWDEALDTILHSKKLSSGKIYDLDGNILFNIDRNAKHEKKTFSTGGDKRRG